MRQGAAGGWHVIEQWTRTRTARVQLRYYVVRLAVLVSEAAACAVLTLPSTSFFFRVVQALRAPD